MKINKGLKKSRDCHFFYFPQGTYTYMDNSYQKIINKCLITVSQVWISLLDLVPQREHFQRKNLYSMVFNLLNILYSSLKIITP